MRFKSRRNVSGQVFVVTGTNTVSFAIVASDAALDGLLGFAVEREDPASGTARWVDGFKVFASLVPRTDARDAGEHPGPPRAEPVVGRLHRPAPTTSTATRSIR